MEGWRLDKAFTSRPIASSDTRQGDLTLLPRVASLPSLTCTCNSARAESERGPRMPFPESPRFTAVSTQHTLTSPVRYLLRHEVGLLALQPTSCKPLLLDETMACIGAGLVLGEIASHCERLTSRWGAMGLWTSSDTPFASHVELVVIVTEECAAEAGTARQNQISTHAGRVPTYTLGRRVLRSALRLRDEPICGTNGLPAH